MSKHITGARDSCPTFPLGSVGYNLMLMRGTWHDQVELFELDGSPLQDDTRAGSGSPGPSPFDNLVYLDFDGHKLSLTNVHFRGRAPSAKTFTGQLRDNLLVFDSLGPGAYENVGVSGGVGILTFNARQLDDACNVYMEPDFIMLTAPGQRVRHTVLYRNGAATRTLTARGSRLSPTCDRRHALDPRGTEGPVHEAPFQARIWEHLQHSPQQSLPDPA
ncbi:hypothetical protein [Biformimicrobium ophioploci]|uniref:Uncharacterized protein n=1 Tax=Biformimicrobium ophioploci TaxID=3036711 RepID=A0ABQ6LW69_9GAMM|nr:hypothetical protein [Microbulbifer sp. NKW57]GMG86301.1 hypothetical protein MNKW57_06220 [Microbulbifer sp. NKW57]